MDTKLEKYLYSIDRYLKPMVTSERADIIREIKSQMIEMEEKEGLSSDEIINRLGDPREMARGYLGDSLAKNTNFNKNKVLNILAFYGLTGLSGAFVIPTLGICAPVFEFCGIVVPVAELIKLIGTICGFNVPFSGINFGSYELNPIIGFPLSVLIGIGFFVAGKKLWKLLLKYLHGISKKKQELCN